MASAGPKKPPLIDKTKSYSDWVRLIKIWTKFTDLDKNKQGPAILMTLQGKSLDAALELTDTEISADTGVNLIIAKLNLLYEKDEINSKFEDLENFESLKRLDNMTVKEFLVDFDQKYSKVKKHGTVISPDLLGFKLLKASNLKKNDEHMVKATCGTIDYDNIKLKIKSIFSNENEKTSNDSGNSIKMESNVKAEPTFLAGPYSSDDDSESNYEDEQSPNTLYTTNRNKSYKQRKSHQPPTNQFRSNNYQHKSSRSGAQSGNWRDQKESKGKNPLRGGQPTRCNICQSINHWATQCPDKNNDNHDVTYLVNELVLTDSILQSLISETWSAAILDSGATSTVCGTTWFNEFEKSLNEIDRAKITYLDSHKPFKFGVGEPSISIKAVKIPAWIGKHNISIQTDIVDCEIPLLLSKSSMKKGKMQINFENDTLEFRNSIIPIKTTSNGLYYLPLTKARTTIESITDDKVTDDKVFVTLRVVDESKSEKEIALKLHEVNQCCRYKMV